MVKTSLKGIENNNTKKRTKNNKRSSLVLEKQNKYVKHSTNEDLVSQAKLFTVSSYHKLENVKEFRSTLIKWFEICRRKLPWRGDALPYTTTVATREASARGTEGGIMKWVQHQNSSLKEVELKTTTSLNKKKCYSITAYRVWVSEVMLQQTRVAVVIPYWLQWMENWPTLRSLAKASEKEIRATWAGLGYYKRALRLLEAAQLLESMESLKRNVTYKYERDNDDSEQKKTIVLNKKNLDEKLHLRNRNEQDSNSVVPSYATTCITQEDIPTKLTASIEDCYNDIPIPSTSIEELTKLPGVGSYTAGAIMSIAFNTPVPAVDGNAIRVVSRIGGIAAVVNSTKLNRTVYDLLQKYVCPEHPGQFNQAIMEIGATICLPRNPNCSICPGRNFCQTYREVQYSRQQLQHKKTVDVKYETCDPRNSQHKDCSICHSDASNYAATTADAYPLSTSFGSLKKKKNEAYFVATVIWKYTNKIEIWLQQRPKDGLLGGEWGPLIEPGCQQRSNAASLGSIRHLFSHVTHHVEVTAIQYNDYQDESLPLLVENGLWLEVDFTRSFIKNYQSWNVTSKYIMKIMEIFLNNLNQLVHTSKMICNDGV